MRRGFQRDPGARAARRVGAASGGDAATRGAAGQAGSPTHDVHAPVEMATTQVAAMLSFCLDIPSRLCRSSSNAASDSALCSVRAGLARAVTGVPGSSSCSVSSTFRVGGGSARGASWGAPRIM